LPIAADKFFSLGGCKTTILDYNEIVTEIRIPVLQSGTGQSFMKFAQRPTIDFASVNAAATITCSGNKVIDARIAIGSVAPVPYRATSAELILKNNVLDENLAEKAAESIIEDAILLKDNPYKLQIAKTLLKRTVLAEKSGF